MSLLKNLLFTVAAAALSLTSVRAQSQVPSIDEALAMSKRSGASVLAMAGLDY